VPIVGEIIMVSSCRHDQKPLGQEKKKKKKSIIIVINNANLKHRTSKECVAYLRDLFHPYPFRTKDKL